ncbi:MAG: 2-hydroxychromene-2-carboxylate isomerase [Burkholderiales bacterium]
MKHLIFYYDVISPYAYLAFERLPVALQGLSYSVEYRPILFAGLLKHHGQLGPAEIAPKRNWTYRQVLWLGQAHGIAIQLPAAHPFNPLALLRLAVACGRQGSNNRHTTEALFRHVWCSGQDAADASRLAALTLQLQPAQDPAGDAVKAQLKANTDEALAQGVFGVPTLAVHDRHFWGLDALPMLRAYLEGADWFAQSHWQQAAQLRGMQRPR